MPAARAAAVACVTAAVLASVAWALHGHRPGVVGFNGIRPSAFVGTIPAHGKVCDTAGSAGSAIDRVQVTVGAEGRGPQPIQLTIPGSAPGPVLRSYADGVVSLMLGQRRARIPGLACVRNLGRLPLRIAGEPAAPGQGARVGGRPAGFHVSFTLVNDSPPTWRSQASSILSRVGLGRAGAGGPATGVIVVVLLFGCLLAVLGTVWRWMS